MKKSAALFTGLLCMMLISGCWGGSNQDQKSNTSKEPNSSQVAQSSSESAGSNSSTSDASSNSTNEPSAESKTKNSASESSVLNEVRSKLKIDVVRLPQFLPVANGKYLSALVSSSEKGYSVTFKQTDRQTKVNDSALKNAKTIATIKATVFPSAADAEKQIPYRKYTSSDGSTVSLGHNITGYSDAGAGTAGISWNEGRWMLAVLSPTSESQKSTNLARQVVEFLEKTALPVPHAYGTAQMYTDSRKDTISWQNGKTVYTINDTSGALTLLKVTASVK